MLERIDYVDAHIHLTDEGYDGQIDEIIEEARQSRVVALVSNSMDFKTSSATLKMAKKYGGIVLGAVGIHPWTVQTMADSEVFAVQDLIEKQCGSTELVAVGEIGLDSKYKSVWDNQVTVFNEMLRLAERFDLPVIVHSRGTAEQVLGMLSSYNLTKVVLHWFSGPMSALSKVVDRGYCITEGPSTLYSNGIREIIDKVPLANLMTETDGPVNYFKLPFKGKRTTPAFIPTVVRSIAEIKKMSVENVALQIRGNFEAFFEVRLN